MPNIGLDPDHLRRLIRWTLQQLPHGAASVAATELLMLTAAHESLLGHWLTQRGGGPARGIYQMEVATHDDLWTNWLRYKTDWRLDVNSLLPRHTLGIMHSVQAGREALMGNLYYATACARAHYRRVPEPLPRAGDVAGLARYWHEHWCRGCAGTPQAAEDMYRRLAREGE